MSENRKETPCKNNEGANAEPKAKQEDKTREAEEAARKTKQEAEIEQRLAKLEEEERRLQALIEEAEENVTRRAHSARVASEIDTLKISKP